MSLNQLRRNLGLLYGGEVLGKLLGLFVFGYLGRTLLPARYGDLEFSLGILFLLNLVIDAGLGHYGAREAAKHPEHTDRLLAQVALVRGALVAVSLVLLAAVALAMPTDRLARALILLQGLALLPAPLVLTWVFQARDEMHVVAVAGIVRQVVLAAGVLILVRQPSDVWMVPVWDGVGLALAVALQVVVFRRAGGVIRIGSHLSGLRTVVRESTPLAGDAIVSAVRFFAPLLALGVLATSTDVGVFGAGHRLVISAHTFVWLYFFNILPSMSRLGAATDLRAFQEFFTTSMRLVAWVAMGGAAIGYVLAPALIPLIYGPSLTAASNPLSTMVWMLVAAFISGHHRFGLIALSRQTDVFKAGIAGAAVSVLGCLAFGSLLTPTKAAGVLVAAEVTTLIGAAIYLHRAVPNLHVLAGLARPAMFTIVSLATLVVWSPSSTVAAAVALGGVFLLGILALERDGLVRLLAARAARTEVDRTDRG